MLHIHYGDLDILRIRFTTERIRKFAKVCQLFLSEKKNQRNHKSGQLVKFNHEQYTNPAD